MPVVEVDVGGHKFKCDQATLTDGSDYFAAQYSGSWTITMQEDGSVFIDRDGEIFSHILAFLRSGDYPIFYDVATGHDFLRYRRLLTEARYFIVGELVAWLEQKRYLKAIKVQTQMRIVDEGTELNLPGNWTRNQTQFYLDKYKSYLCPSRYARHMDDPNECTCSGGTYEDKVSPRYAELCTSFEIVDR